MTTAQDPIAHAARLLRETAEELRQEYTLSSDRNNWIGEPEAKAAYDEHTAAAQALEDWEQAIGAGGVQALSAAPGEPSDAEIDEFIDLHCWDANGRRSIVRHAIARWGAAPTTRPAPQQEAQEPVASEEDLRKLKGLMLEVWACAKPQPDVTNAQLRALLSRCLPHIRTLALAEAPQQEPSPTAGMNIAQRILHVGGRNNAAGYVEFGSIQAVEALVRQVLRDLPATEAPHKAPAESEQDLRTRFEALARDSYNFSRSRRGYYTNPSVARDWKWFRLGANAAAQGGE